VIKNNWQLAVPNRIHCNYVVPPERGLALEGSEGVLLVAVIIVGSVWWRAGTGD
jgi:hypothetical protein